MISQNRQVTAKNISLPQNHVKKISGNHIAGTELSTSVKGQVTNQTNVYARMYRQTDSVKSY